MISIKLEQTLRKALLIAAQYRETQANIEHLTLALLYDQDVVKAIGVTIDLDKVIEEVKIYFVNNKNKY